jgi:hypothetical protein
VTTEGSSDDVARGGLRVYADYIAEQVALQEARKGSIESRAVFVLTSSGALATLLLGLAAFAGKTDALALSDASEGWLRIAIIAFVVAGMLALGSNIPLAYRSATPSELSAAIDDADDDDEDFATKAVAYNRLTLVENAARINGWKAIVLAFALLAEVAAVVAIARCVWLTL